MSGNHLRELIAVQKPAADIRYLTVVSTLTRGGTERATVNYALGYGRAGLPSAVLAYGGGGPRQAALEAEHIPVFVGGETLGQQERAVAAAREWNPDILHLNRFGQTDARSADVLRSLVHPRMRVLETNVFAAADRSPDRLLIDLHMHLSRWCLWKWTQSMQGVAPRSPGMVIPYSVDCAAFQPPSDEQRLSLRRQYQVPEDAIVFGRVGQASLAKWSPLLFPAFEAVARQLPHAWLALCGLPPELRGMLDALPPEIRARVRELPITDNDSRLRGYYGLMDIFLHLADKGESFGLVLCEAMLSGVPVITLCTPLRDNSQIEVVAHGKTGWVVRGLEQTIDAMLVLGRDRPLFLAMRRQAPEWVRQNYDIPLVSRHLQAVAAQALAASSASQLASGLRSMPDARMTTSSGVYRELLASAGIQPELLEGILISIVNRPISRTGVSLARAAQSGLRRLSGRR